MKKTLHEVEYLEDTSTLARFAKALGHPTRVKILKILASQQFCYTGDLVEEIPLAQSTISQHLKELKEAGLIKGEINPPKIKYCLNAANWQLAQQLFQDFFKDQPNPNC